MFTVGPHTRPLQATGGLTLVPAYDYQGAPAAKVIVVPAHRSTDATLEWLRSRVATADLIMSVCTGAFILGRARLLDGRTATTHHEFWDDFERSFPKVKLKRGPRFVEHERIATAGGLTSGIDLALRVVERYYGRETGAGHRHLHGVREPFHRRERHAPGVRPVTRRKLRHKWLWSANPVSSATRASGTPSLGQRNAGELHSPAEHVGREAHAVEPAKRARQVNRVHLQLGRERRKPERPAELRLHQLPHPPQPDRAARARPVPAAGSAPLSWPAAVPRVRAPRHPHRARTHRAAGGRATRSGPAAGRAARRA